MTHATIQRAQPLPDAVTRLACGGQEGFLLAHQIEVASRLLGMFERARLRQRVTMSYDPTRVGRAKGGGQADLAASAGEARKQLAELAGRLPPDCWGVLVDVCVYDKGLQEVEQERGWPRRAAKLVLRIGLDQAASLLGLGAEARGREHGVISAWLPERVAMF